MSALRMALFLFALGCIVEHVAGCIPSAKERTENALVVGVYERELDHCKAQGKAAGSYAVYEACANAVDRLLCIQRGVRCADGGAP